MSTTQMQGTAMACSLTVKELEKSVEWYTKGLGWEVARRIERDGVLRGMALKAGEVNIILNQDDFKKGTDRVKGVGMSFSIYVNGDIDALGAQAKASGITLEADVQDAAWSPGLRFFRAKDPDGFRWTVMKRQG